MDPRLSVRAPRPGPSSASSSAAKNGPTSTVASAATASSSTWLARGTLGGRSLPPLDVWYVNGQLFVHYLDSTDQVILVVPLCTNIAEGGGSTVLCPSSVGTVTKWLFDHPEGCNSDMVPRSDLCFNGTCGIQTRPRLALPLARRRARLVMPFHCYTPSLCIRRRPTRGGGCYAPSPTPRAFSRNLTTFIGRVKVQSSGTER